VATPTDTRPPFLQASPLTWPPPLGPPFPRKPGAQEGQRTSPFRRGCATLPLCTRAGGALPRHTRRRNTRASTRAPPQHPPLPQKPPQQPPSLRALPQRPRLDSRATAIPRFDRRAAATPPAAATAVATRATTPPASTRALPQPPRLDTRAVATPAPRRASLPRAARTVGHAVTGAPACMQGACERAGRGTRFTVIVRLAFETTFRTSGDPGAMGEVTHLLQKKKSRQ
jgi:hypothetical protein